MEWPSFLINLAHKYSYQGFEITVKFEWNNLMKDLKQYMFKFMKDEKEIKRVNKEFYHLYYFYQEQNYIFKMMKKYYRQNLTICKTLNTMLFPSFIDNLDFKDKILNKALKENFSPYLIKSKCCYCENKDDCICLSGLEQKIDENEFKNFQKFIIDNSLLKTLYVNQIIKIFNKFYGNEDIDWIEKFNISPRDAIKIYNIDFRCILYRKYFVNDIQLLLSWFVDEYHYSEKYLNLVQNHVNFLILFLQNTKKQNDKFVKIRKIGEKIVNINKNEEECLYRIYEKANEPLRKSLISIKPIARFIAQSFKNIDEKTKIYLMLTKNIELDFDICVNYFKNNNDIREWEFFCRLCNKDELLNLNSENNFLNYRKYYILKSLIKKGHIFEESLLYNCKKFSNYRLLDLEYGSFTKNVAILFIRENERDFDQHTLEECKNIKMAYYVYKLQKEYRYHHVLTHLFPIIMEEKDTELLDLLFKYNSEEKVKKLINDYLNKNVKS